MTTMQIYQDPGDSLRRRPNLVDGLMSWPATIAHHQVENQFTEALGWLIDRSDAFARRFVMLFAEDPESFRPYLDAAARIGARTQVQIPSPKDGGSLFPDLSVDGSDRSFQLLVEVKVGAEFGSHVIGGQALLQPDAYAAAWALVEQSVQAEVRLVGTPSVAGPPESRPHPMRGRDVTWLELRDALSEQLDDDALEEDVRLVAADLVEAIDERILAEPPSGEALERFLSEATPLVARVAKLIGSRIPGASVGPVNKPAEYRSAYVHFDTAEDGHVALWLVCVPKGSRMNFRGQPDLFFIEPRRDPDTPFDTTYAERLIPAGFAWTRLIDGWTGFRLVVPLGEARAVSDELEDQADLLATKAVDALTAAALIA